jgi:hypothetical protein
MKKTILLLSLIALTSCKTLSILSKQDVNTNESSEKIELNKNRILINCKIEDKPQTFEVDLGATTSVIFDTLVIPNYYKREKGTFGSVKSADSKATKSSFVALKVNNNLVSGSKKAFLVLPIYNQSMSQYDCIPSDSKNDKIGLYGYDFFGDDDYVTVMDFDKLAISNYKNERLNELIQGGYHEIKSEFDDRWLSVFVTINSVEYKFKIDTGYNGSFCIPFKKDLNFLNEAHQSIEGNLYHTLTGTTKNKTDYFFNDKELVFNNSNYKTVLTISQSIKAQNVGIGFIKGFNWIIDFKNKKLYVKKNGLELDTKSSYTKKYIIVAENHKLKIMAKNTLETKYNVGDEITAINYTKVTPENICEMQDLIRKTEDLNTLNIEVIPVSK